MSSIDERAGSIVTYLMTHERRGLRRWKIMADLGLQPGRKTDKAFQRSWQIIKAAGRHLPAACPQNGFEYRITGDPNDAVAPAAHLTAIAAGVLRRAADGVEFMDAKSEGLDEDSAAMLASLVPDFARLVDDMDEMRDAMRGLAVMAQRR